MELVTLQQSAAVATSNGAGNEEQEALAHIKELEESFAAKEHHYKSEVSIVILCIIS